jgi:tRNA(Ile)-lysidine synthase
MASVEQQVRESIERDRLLLAGDTVVVGVSGGPDSLCLLHVLRGIAPECRIALHVAHLNHRIRGVAADEDARYVAELCTSWGLPCTVQDEDVPALARERGLAIEETARQVRYAFLGALACRVGGRTVTVAHNADDQVETVLMHLLRGSGLAGLRGMRPLIWLDDLRLGDSTACWHEAQRIRLIRPLLCVSRAAIEDYCRAHDLQPRFDLSNLDQTYYRNRLRHDLLPVLETYNPAIRQVLRRTAEAIAADYDLLHQQVLEMWPRVVCRETAEVINYDLAELRSLPLSLQRSALREGIHRLRRTLRNINWVHIEGALNILARGSTGMGATLPQGLLLTLGYAEATLASQGYVPEGEDWPRLQGGPLPLGAPGSLDLPGGRWCVTTQITVRQNLPDDWAHNPHPYSAYLDAGRITAPLALRSRQEGDWFAPLGLHRHRQKLSDFLTNAQVPRHERSTVPLLVCGQEIAWVVGWRIDARYAVQEETRQVLVVNFTRKLSTDG